MGSLSDFPRQVIDPAGHQRSGRKARKMAGAKVPHATGLPFTEHRAFARPLREAAAGRVARSLVKLKFSLRESSATIVKRCCVSKLSRDDIELHLQHGQDIATEWLLAFALTILGQLFYRCREGSVRIASASPESDLITPVGERRPEESVFARHYDRLRDRIDRALSYRCEGCIEWTTSHSTQRHMRRRHRESHSNKL